MITKNTIPIGFYLNEKKHKEISSFCKEHGIALDSFCRVAVLHFYFQLTNKAASWHEDFLNFIETFSLEKGETK